MSEAIKPVKSIDVATYEEVMNEYNEAVRELNTSTMLRANIYTYDTESDVTAHLEEGIAYAEKRAEVSKRVIFLAGILKDAKEDRAAYEKYMSDLYNFHHAK